MVSSMTQGFFTSSQHSTLFQYSTLFSALLLTACKGDESNDPEANLPSVTTPSSYVLEIAPASEQIKALLLYSKTNVDLASYIKSDGLINLRLSDTLKVNKAFGAKENRNTQNQCELAKPNGLDIAIEFSRAGACILEYQVIGETLNGVEITQKGQITLIGSQKPEFAVLPPMSLVLIDPLQNIPYDIDLDASPHPVLNKAQGSINQESSLINNDILTTGNYVFPEGFFLTDLTLGSGEGFAEANKNYAGLDKINSIKYTANNAQLGYSQISYLIEKEEGEAQLGQIHISVNTKNNHAPEAYDFCKPILSDNWDENGNLFVEIDLTPYVYDPDASTHLTLDSLSSLTGTFTTSATNPLGFRFIVTQNDAPYHLISYVIKDGLGGFDVGQIKLAQNDDLSITTHTLSAGYSFGYQLDEMGKLWVTGENSQGNLGLGNTENQSTWVQPDALKNIGFDAVVANQGAPIQTDNLTYELRYGYLLDKDGFIWVSGNNELGQLGNGDNTNVSSWQKITECEISDNYRAACPTFTHLSAGSIHGYALDIKGRIWSAGFNGYGQLGRNSASTKPYPYSAYWSPSLCTSAYGEESQNPSYEIPCPVFTSIDAGPYNGYAIDEEKNLWVIGNNRNGQLGAGEALTMGDNAENTNLGSSQYRWVKINKVADQNGALTSPPSFIQASAGGANSTNSFGYALSTDGYLYATGDATNGQLANAHLSDSANNRTQIWSKVTHTRSLTSGASFPILFKAVSAGHEHTYALAKDCGIWAVGANVNGQLATGTNTPASTNKWTLPKKSDGRYFSGIGVTEFSAGANTSYIKTNDSFWGVGEKTALGLTEAPEDNNLYLWQKLPSLH